MRISDWSSDVCSSDLMEDGLPALNAVQELMADLGRPRDNLYEVALWEDLVTVRGDEVFYAYMVVNQAIVITETIHAIRDRKSFVSGKRVSVRVHLGGCLSIKKHRATEAPASCV